jgi:hypothetical protein
MQINRLIGFCTVDQEAGFRLALANLATELHGDAGAAIDDPHVESDTGRYSEWKEADRAIERCKELKAEGGQPALVIPTIPSRNVPLLKKLDQARQAGISIVPLSLMPKTEPQFASHRIGFTVLTANEKLPKALASATRWVARQSNAKLLTAKTKKPSKNLGKHLKHDKLGKKLRAKAGDAKKEKARQASEKAWGLIRGYLESGYPISEITERLNNQGEPTRRGGKFTFTQVVRIIKSRWPEFTVRQPKKGVAND